MSQYSPRTAVDYAKSDASVGFSVQLGTWPLTRFKKLRRQIRQPPLVTRPPFSVRQKQRH